MKLLFVISIFLTTTLTSYGIVPEKYFAKIFQDSREAYALATAHIGTFKEPRLNALTNRIQDDQRVLLETLRDTARMKNFDLPASSGSPSLQRLPTNTFLKREISLHENILKNINHSSSPILENMRQRVKTALENARGIHDSRLQAQEEQAAKKRRWP